MDPFFQAQPITRCHTFGMTLYFDLNLCRAVGQMLSFIFSVGVVDHDHMSLKPTDHTCDMTFGLPLVFCLVPTAGTE